MTKNKNKSFIIFIVLYFAFFGCLLAIGSVHDLKVENAVFNPTNGFARFFEIWGEVPRFAMWAPAATVLLFTRHSLAECLEIIHRIFPFIPVIKEEHLKNSAYKFFNFVVNAVEIIGFTAIAFLGWDKVIRNVGKYYIHLSRGIWYAIAAVVTIIVFLLFTKIPKRILNKLEPLALMGILMGIFFCFESTIKGIANRVRYREMVAFTYGIEDAKDASVTSALINGTDFSMYTEWYQKGNGGSMLNGLELEGLSCPSGHMISGCFLFLSTVLFSCFEKLKKLAAPACVFCFAYVGALGFTRMVRGAHFLSDISLGAMVGMIFFLIAFGLYKLLCSKDVLPTRALD